MKNKLYAVGLTAAFAMLAGAAHAQLLYSQKYTPRQASFTSRVTNCAEHRPYPKIALDDWKAGVNSPVTKIVWWGVLTNTAQAQKPFFVAIYKDNGAGKPVLTSMIAQKCVVPAATPTTMVDCQGRKIWMFTAKFPVGWFNQTAGIKYWLQVSESDKESAKVLSEDFRWSGRRPILNSPAVQFSASGVFNTLVDLCDQLRDDLSFEIWRS
jgi:hypothetical protein